MITRIDHSYNFFKQPHRVGDIIDLEEKIYYVIGIENINFGVAQKKVLVRYTVQELKLGADYIDMPSKPLLDPHYDFSQTVKVDDLKKKLAPWETTAERPLENCRPGQSFDYEGQRFKIIEYTDIEVDGMDFRISFSARAINPISRKEAKARLLQERKERTGISLL